MADIIQEARIDTLAVIIKSTDNKYYQLALTDDMVECLLADLRLYFDGGVYKVLPDELLGIEISKPDKNQ